MDAQGCFLQLEKQTGHGRMIFKDCKKNKQTNKQTNKRIKRPQKEVNVFQRESFITFLIIG